MRSPAPTDRPTLSIAAACLFDSAGRLLLVRKRGTHAWMLPGGKLEAGEDSLSALTRELQEELDLHLPADALGWLGHFQAMAANEADTWLDAQVYHAHLPHPVHPAAELEALSWLDLRAELPADLAPLLREQVLPRLADSHYRAE